MLIAPPAAIEDTIVNLLAEALLGSEVVSNCAALGHHGGADDDFRAGADGLLPLRTRAGGAPDRRSSACTLVPLPCKASTISFGSERLLDP